MPSDLLWAHSKGTAPRVDTAAQSSLAPHLLNAHDPEKGQHQPYHQRSPAHHGSQPPSSSCPPPAGRSWCRTGRSGSPAAGKGLGGSPTHPHQQRPLSCGKASHPPGPLYLLTVLQLVHPELGSLETATVREIWGEESGSADTAAQCPTHCCHPHPSPRPFQPPLFRFPILRALTVADDGSPGSPVVDAAHGLVALRARRVLGRQGSTRDMTAVRRSRESLSQGVARDVSGAPLAPALTQMPRVTVCSPTVITLATKAAPIVCKRSNRSGGNRPGEAGASGLGPRWKPAQGHGGIHPGGCGRRARKRGDRPTGRTRWGNNTKGRRPRDVGGSTPGTRRGNEVTAGRIAGVTGEGLIPGRRGRHGGRHAGDARE